MKRKLSARRPRSELIASFAYAVPAPPPAKVPPADGAPPSEQDADSAVSDAIAAISAAVKDAQAAQKADPDATDPDDRKVAAVLEQISQAVAGLTGDQKADEADEGVTAAGPAVAEKPDTSPVDEDGNIDPDAVCANPDCQHLASAHVDMPEGQHTGACSMPGCECLAFQVDAQANTGKGGANQPDNSPQGAEPGANTEELAHAPVSAVPDAPAPPAPARGMGSELNGPPEIEGGQPMGPAFTIPVAIIEGQPTGDGRQIAPGALAWRTPPLPLMGLATETHDPNGFDQNDPAVICGRIDTLERAPGEGDTQIIVAKGYFLPNDDGTYFAELVEKMGRCGISADVAVEASEIEVGEIDQDGWPTDMAETLTEGTIMGLTLVPFPAFEGAYIVLGDNVATTPIPQSAGDGGEPEAIAASIHFMAYEACEPCDQGLELLASAGPVAPPRAWFEDPGFTEDDGRLVEILDRRGQRAMGGKYACPLTVTETGRVYGHLAPWGVCHIGKPGCVTAPQSQSGYAYFKRGQHVLTAEGEKVRVGTLTVNAGHADVHSSPTAAMAHYDNIATAVADVNCGEDEYGIWVAGAIRPSATDEQVRALRASSVSGDWRGLGGSLELVAALAVPVPGFPHAVVAGAEQETLVASGASVMHRLKHPAPAEPEPEGDVALRRALSPLLRDARDFARLSLAPLRS